MVSRIAVLISGGGTNLQALLDNKEKGYLPHGEFAVVVANRADAYGLVRAQAKGIPTQVLIKGESQEKFEAELAVLLESYRVDLIVLAGFLSILSADFVRKYPRRIVNIHPSLIPAFCGKGMYGLHVHRAALERGVKLSGATVHYVNERTDEGEIIAQKSVEVREGDSPETLQRRVMEEAEWVLLPQVVEKVAYEIAQEREKWNI